MTESIVISKLARHLPDEIKARGLAFLSEKHDEQSSQTAILSRRKLKKIDKFTAMAYEAIADTIDDKMDLEKTGLIVGNNFAGWGYVEDQMPGLYEGDFDAINPYVATAWFPAAVQGEVSIDYGLLGYSKTVTSGDLSAAFALEHAMHMIKRNKLETVICGGVEALATKTLQNYFNEIEDGVRLYDAAAFFRVESRETVESNHATRCEVEELSFFYSEEALRDKLKQCDKESLILHSLNLTSLVSSMNFPSSYTWEQNGDVTAGSAFAIDICFAYDALSTHNRAVVVRKDKLSDQFCFCSLTLEALCP